MKRLMILIIPLFFILQACNTVKMEKDPSKASPVIVYSKGPCFGSCPIFTLTIYNTGLAKFKGRRFTKMDGVYQKQLNKKEYTDLIKLFRKNRFWRFDNNYDMQLVDLSTVTLSFADKGKTKTVKGKAGFPEKFKILTAALDSLINSGGWEMIEKPANNKREGKVIENQIIIKLGKGMILSRWLQEYKKYGVRLMRKLGDDNKYWLIRYDTKKIAPEKMLQLLHEDKRIAEAEFNKEVFKRVESK